MDRGVTAGRRNDFCNLGPMLIPRPKCTGMEFVQTKGRQGFYLSIRRHGYGIEMKDQGPKRPPLSAVIFERREESSEDTDSFTVSELTEKSSLSDADTPKKKPEEKVVKKKVEFVEKL